MSRVFDVVIEQLREDLFRMGGLSEAILEKALRAVWERNAQLAEEVAKDDLERVGDLARNIAKGARRLAEKTALPFPATLTALSRASQAALRCSLDAFGRSDPDLARRVLDEDDGIDDQHDEVIRTLVRRLEAGSEGVSQNVDAIQLAKHLERIADHATNIAEDVILVAEARNVKHAEKLAR